MKVIGFTSTGTRPAPFSTGLALVVILGLAPLFGWGLARENWLVVGGLGVVALVPVFIRWPVVSTLGLYAFLTTSFDSLPLLEGVSTLTRPAGVLAAAVLLGVGLMERRLVRPPAAAVWWALFTVWAFMTIAWALDPQLPINRLPRAVSLVALYLVAVSFRPTRREFYWVCALTVLGGVIAASMGYFFGLEEAPGGRARLTFGEQGSNPNALGRMVLLPLGLAIAGFIGLRGAAPKVVAVGCAGILAVGVYISMSRSALVAMITVIGVLFYRVRARWQIVATCGVLAALAMAMPARFYERVGAVLSGEDSTGSGRTEIWKAGMAALDQFWLIGAGLDNYVEVHSAAVVLNRGGFGAHNTYLGVLVELGIVGFALMLAAMGAHLLAVQRLRRAGHHGFAMAALEAVSIGMMMQMVFSDVLWSRTFWLVWILLAWVVRAETQARRESAGAVPARVDGARGEPG